jgi:septal ring factor EnvC (AmiA/AmiB activator)
MWLELAIQAALLLVFAVVIFIWLGKGQRQLSAQLAQLEKRLEYSAQQQEQSQHEIEELRTGLIGVGQRVLQLDSALNQHSAELGQAVQQLSDKQQAMELTEPESKIYSRAMKMVQLGADLDEIIRECELPRAEAELLYNLHQQKTQR